MKIGDKDPAERCLLVAEIGNNHEGRFEVAQELVVKAAECGADAVKFQVFRTEYFVSPRDSARFARLKSFELGIENFRKLAALARSRGLSVIATPFDLQSAGALTSLVDAFKIASGDNNFIALLDAVLRSKKPLIISTGLCDWAQLERLVQYLREKMSDAEFRIHCALLHCVSGYPCPADELNLSIIPRLGNEFGCVVGFSDHSMGVKASLLAAALGARIVEKHFTLNKRFSGYHDHQLSADPQEMAELAQGLKEMDRMLGQPDKDIQPSERINLRAARRSIVAGAELPQGHRVVASDLTWMRPADGLPPGEENRLLGRFLKHSVCFGDPILPDDVI